MEQIRAGEERSTIILWPDDTDGGREQTKQMLGICIENGRRDAAINYLHERFPSVFGWFTTMRLKRRQGDPVKFFDDSTYHTLQQSRRTGPRLC